MLNLLRAAAAVLVLGWSTGAYTATTRTCLTTGDEFVQCVHRSPPPALKGRIAAYSIG
jgi:hypothetical protein